VGRYEAGYLYVHVFFAQSAGSSLYTNNGITAIIVLIVVCSIGVSSFATSNARAAGALASTPPPPPVAMQDTATSTDEEMDESVGVGVTEGELDRLLKDSGVGDRVIRVTPKVKKEKREGLFVDRI
jgi:hypothetical protein